MEMHQGISTYNVHANPFSSWELQKSSLRILRAQSSEFWEASECADGVVTRPFTYKTWDSAAYLICGGCQSRLTGMRESNVLGSLAIGYSIPRSISRRLNVVQHQIRLRWCDYTVLESMAKHEGNVWIVFNLLSLILRKSNSSDCPTRQLGTYLVAKLFTVL